MFAQNSWIPFSLYALMHIEGKPGVYELADVDEVTVFIGSAENLRAQIEAHLMDPAASCVKLHAAKIRVEYTDDYETQEQNLRSLFQSAYGCEPVCNRDVVP